MEVVHCKKVFDDPNVIYIGRPGLFGNPFRMKNKSDEERALVIEDYKIWFEKRMENDPTFRRAVLALRGHDLSCWCPPKPCHGDVIIEWLSNHKKEHSTRRIFLKDD
jgi:Domain of unknown function (DUF4326)